jgi:hypothetical protein
MPKKPTPETFDRYRIHAETSIEQMGGVLAVLTKLGLQNIGYELITTVADSFRRNVKHETTAEQAVIEYVKTNPTFQLSELVAHFKAEGRTKTAIYQACKILANKGALKRLSPGNYSAASVKAIEGPKKKAGEIKPAKKAKPIKKPKYALNKFGISGNDEVLRWGKKRKSFTTQQVRELFVASGRMESSAYPTLNDLVNKKKIKRIGGPGSGEYTVRAKTLKDDIAARGKLNGKAPHRAAEDVPNVTSAVTGVESSNNG